jgi:hypothetical protein
MPRSINGPWSVLHPPCCDIAVDVGLPVGAAAESGSDLTALEPRHLDVGSMKLVQPSGAFMTSEICETLDQEELQPIHRAIGFAFWLFAACARDVWAFWATGVGSDRLAVSVVSAIATGGLAVWFLGRRRDWTVLGIVRRMGSLTLPGVAVALMMNSMLKPAPETPAFMAAHGLLIAALCLPIAAFLIAHASELALNAHHWLARRQKAQRVGRDS